MTQKVHHVVIDPGRNLAVRPPGEDDKLDSQQGHQEQSGLHCLQVPQSVMLTIIPDLLHQHTEDVEQKEEVDLQRYDVVNEQTIQIRTTEGNTLSLILYLMWGAESTYTGHGDCLKGHILSQPNLLLVM